MVAYAYNPSAPTVIGEVETVKSPESEGPDILTCTVANSKETTS